jgi:16S rRNA (guanine527-N7)-methyltransferase
MDKIFAAAGVRPAPEQSQQLQAYVDLLLKWNKKINLIGKSTEREVWERHVLDCAQLAPHLPAGQTVLDVGSGAGLPAVILAILCASDVTACEKVSKKCDFLQEVRRTLALSDRLRILNCDVRELKEKKARFHTITARAVAPLVDLIDLTDGLLADGGQYVFLKGQTVADELADVRRKYHMTETLISSITSSAGGVILLKPLK